MKTANDGTLNGADGTNRTDAHHPSFCYAPDPEGYLLKPALATGWEYVLNERMRQMEHPGWSRELDDSYVKWELRRAAECYHRPAAMRWVDDNGFPKKWPWEARWWMPCDDRTRDLMMAGALYLAESARVRRLGHLGSATILRNRAIACAVRIDWALFAQVLKKVGPIERGKVTGRNFRKFFEKHRASKIQPV